MAEVIPVELGDGTVIHAEVTRLGEHAVRAGGSVGGDAGVREVAERALEALPLGLDAVGDLVRGVGRWAAEAVKDTGAERPDTFEVEFGLTLAVKSGKLIGVLAEAGGEAALTVRMGWNTGGAHRPQPDEQPAGSSP